MNGDFCPYFVFQTEVATAWGHGFAGEFICLNIQPTILQPVQEVSVFHQNVLSVVKGLVFLDVTITSDVQQKPAVRKLSLNSTDLKFRFFSVVLPAFPFYCLSYIFSPPVLKPFSLEQKQQTQWRLVPRREGHNFLSVG